MQCLREFLGGNKTPLSSPGTVRTPRPAAIDLSCFLRVYRIVLQAFGAAVAAWSASGMPCSSLGSPVSNPVSY